MFGGESSNLFGFQRLAYSLHAYFVVSLLNGS
jgi:hypothetical protein